jgi:hypothetical protein
MGAKYIEACKKLTYRFAFFAMLRVSRLSITHRIDFQVLR